MTNKKSSTIMFSLNVLATGIAFDCSSYGVCVAFAVLSLFWVFVVIDAHSLR